MKWHFENRGRLGELATSLARWDGTPFLQRHAKVGVGVDCVRFAREVYRECGVDVSAAEDIPNYGLGWGLQQEHSQLLAWIHECPGARARFARIDPDDPWMAGDLVILRRGLSAHHLGIIGPGELDLWHVDIPDGVVRVDLQGAREHFKPVSIRRLRA